MNTNDICFFFFFFVFCFFVFFCFFCFFCFFFFHFWRNGDNINILVKKKALTRALTKKYTFKH